MPHHKARRDQTLTARGQGRGALRYLSEVELEAWRALLLSTNHLTRTLNQELSDSTGVSLLEYEILVRLVESPNRDLRMAQLARSTAMSRSRLTHTVGRLEKSGLVERYSSGEDRRGVHCRLTATGVDFLREAAPGHLGAVREHFASHFQEEELTALAGLLSRLPRE